MYKTFFRFGAAITAALAGLSCATAQTEAVETTAAASSTQQAQTPPPPCQEDIYRAFDFWLGDWDVFDLNDKKKSRRKQDFFTGARLPDPGGVDLGQRRHRPEL